ncbi:transposase family protein [Methylobacterium mesophilicum SR1.6/6]|uniref:Transposase family protein n=1 Tax=Methylobacterium mesophilicum SR1.6/6 TaxID=908290 RepID=A0A6B9FHA2_9HYPH|nr:transposase family protein [Methylobacterium mesophilicum SR1.6/6]
MGGYLYVAIDRAFRYVHLAVRDDETTASAVAFLRDALRAFPFRVTHVLTDRGFCFTADGFEAACERQSVQHRKTRPYTPKTNGMVERFNGRVQREVVGSPSTATLTWRSCCVASTQPTTAAGSAYCVGSRPKWCCASVSKPIPHWPTQHRDHRIPAS